MRRRYSFSQLGSPSQPGICTSSDGNRVNLDPATYSRWKSKDFKAEVVAKMVHEPEDIGTAVYSVYLV